MNRVVANLALDIGFLFVAGALAVPFVVAIAAFALWSEHREVALLLVACGVVFALLTWIPAISNIEDCASIRSEPTEISSYEEVVFAGKIYYAPIKIANDDRRLNLLEKGCGDFPYNIA